HGGTTAFEGDFPATSIPDFRVQASLRGEVADMLPTLLRTLPLRAAPTEATACTAKAIQIGQQRYMSKFRFTLDHPKLSSEQRQFYEDNGYLIVKGMFKPQDLQKFARRFEDIASGKVKVPGLTVMRDISLRDVAKPEKYVVNKVQDIFLDEQLWEYCTYPQVLDWTEAFVGSNQMAVHTMLINKPPDIGTLTSRHPLHQDLYYFPFRPADRIVCAWTAIERVTRENGCLVGVPGTHKGGLLEHAYPEWEGGVNKAYHGIKNFEEVIGKRVYFEMDAGDTVLFHPLLIHGSGANRTKGFRKAISCHYAASECEYIDVTGTNQENIAKEVLEIAHRRGIPVTDYRDAWRYRSQLREAVPAAGCEAVDVIPRKLQAAGHNQQSLIIALSSGNSAAVSGVNSTVEALYERDSAWSHLDDVAGAEFIGIAGRSEADSKTINKFHPSWQQ
ncbi:phytanoyl-CoA dioxygenase, partial [Tropilaelaps mercedesae]